MDTKMTPFLLRSEFLSMTDARLAEWELVLVDEVNHGPRATVRLTVLELEVLRQVMAERGVR
jgi:hypothetical protein